MENITISFGIVDDCIKQIVFDDNGTDYPNDSETLRKIAIALLRIIEADKDKGSLKVQDLLNELNIKRSIK